MKRPPRQTLLLSCLLGLVSLAAHSFSLNAAPARPNILFVLADDLGWSDLGCYGAPFNETPRLDRLASEGVRFTQAYSAGAVCSPTRASIMTGKFPVRTGVTDYIPGLSGEGRKLVTRRTDTQLPLEETTLAEALREGGYQTFYSGKWHLGGSGFEPPQQGFDRYDSGDRGGTDRKQDWQVGKRIAEAAADFIRKRDAAHPFFAFVSFHEPHTPIVEYPDHIARFRAKAAKLPPLTPPWSQEHEGRARVRQDDPAYASEVAGLDSYVGMLLDQLDTLGLRDSTIVVFTSDNGGLSVRPLPGPTSNAPLRAGKGWLYEGGIRVPLIVRAPGIARAGSVIEMPVISTDHYPTLLALAGLPAKPEQHRDGLTFSQALQGNVLPGDRILFWHYPHYHGSTWAPGAALRSADWKLVEQLEYGTVELFNLRDDLCERRDLSREKPELTASLLARLHDWQRSVGAFVPSPRDKAATPLPYDGSASKKKRKRQKRDGQAP